MHFDVVSSRMFFLNASIPVLQLINVNGVCVVCPSSFSLKGLPVFGLGSQIQSLSILAPGGRVMTYMISSIV